MHLPSVSTAASKGRTIRQASSPAVGFVEKAMASLSPTATQSDAEEQEIPWRLE
jgi:hypothetical protein